VRSIEYGIPQDFLISPILFDTSREAVAICSARTASPGRILVVGRVYANFWNFLVTSLVRGINQSMSFKSWAWK